MKLLYHVIQTPSMECFAGEYDILFIILLHDVSLLDAKYAARMRANSSVLLRLPRDLKITNFLARPCAAHFQDVDNITVHAYDGAKPSHTVSDQCRIGIG